MPPRPIDSRNVYQKTLYAQQEVDKLHEGNEKDKNLRQQLIARERDQHDHDQVEINRERTPTRPLERDAHREKREKHKKKDQESDAENETEELETLTDDLRKRLPEDDVGKGDKLDVKG